MVLRRILIFLDFLGDGVTTLDDVTCRPGIFWPVRDLPLKKIQSDNRWHFELSCVLCRQCFSGVEPLIYPPSVPTLLSLFILPILPTGALPATCQTFRMLASCSRSQYVFRARNLRLLHPPPRLGNYPRQTCPSPSPDGGAAGPSFVHDPTNGWNQGQIFDNFAEVPR